MDALTKRELHVARLVVDGKTNPEIAAELFLRKDGSVAPAPHLQKMDVTSRVDLARAIERADRLVTARPD